MTEPNPTEGVQFPVTGERRSSTETGKTIMSRAAAAVDEGLARDIASASEWRKTYVDHVGDLVAAGIPSHERTRSIAEAGLEAMRDTMVFVRGDEEVPLPEAFEKYTDPAFETFEMRGENKPAVTLSIPFRGDRLEGDDTAAPAGRVGGEGRDRAIVQPSRARGHGESRVAGPERPRRRPPRSGIRDGPSPDDPRLGSPCDRRRPAAARAMGASDRGGARGGRSSQHPGTGGLEDRHRHDRRGRRSRPDDRGPRGSDVDRLLRRRPRPRQLRLRGRRRLPQARRDPSTR